MNQIHVIGFGLVLFIIALIIMLYEKYKGFNSIDSYMFFILPAAIYIVLVILSAILFIAEWLATLP